MQNLAGYSEILPDASLHELGPLFLGVAMLKARRPLRVPVSRSSFILFPQHVGASHNLAADAASQRAHLRDGRCGS